MKKRLFTRVLANFLTFGLLFNEISSPLLVSAEESASEDSEEEVVVDDTEDIEENVSETPQASDQYFIGNDERLSRIDEDNYYYFDSAPTSWGEAVVTSKDPVDNILYKLYGNSSGYKLLVCADAYDSYSHSYGTYQKFRLSGYDICITHNYLAESLSSYRNNITEIVFRGIEEIDNGSFSLDDQWFGNMAKLKKVYFDENYGSCACDENSDFYYGWKHHYSRGACIAIKEGTFANNPQLEEFLMPEYLRGFNREIFYNCPKLKKVFCADGTNNPYPEVSVGKHLNKDLTYIDIDSFKGCNALTSFYFPRSLKEIERGAFENCTSLKVLDLRGTALTSLSGFEGCTGLETVYLPFNEDLYVHKWSNYPQYNGNFIHYSDYNDFYVKERRTQTYNSDEENLYIKIETSAFEGCTNLTTVYAGDGITDIYSSAFNGCTKLKTFIDLREEGDNHDAYEQDNYEGDEYSWSFPKSIKTIGSYAFSECPELSFDGNMGSFDIYATSIGYGAFKNSYKTHIYDGKTYNSGYLRICSESPCTIDENAFENCNALIEFYYCGPVTVKKDAFKNAYLYSTNIPTGSTIEKYAFRNAKFGALSYPTTSLTFGNNCIIGSEALTDSPVTRITIGTGATISDKAFINNENLSVINMPTAITSLGDDLFVGCNLLLEKNKLNSTTNTVMINAEQSAIENLDWLSPEEIKRWIGLPVKSITCKSGDGYGYIRPAAWIYATDIDLEVSSLTMKKGDTKYVKYSLVPENTDASIVWSSDNTSVATVNSGYWDYNHIVYYGSHTKYDGTFYIDAVDTGTATITAKTIDGAVVKTITVNVTATGDGSVWVSSIADDSGDLEGDLSIPVGQTEQLRWIISPVNATNKNVSFLSLDPDIMSVSETGLVTCVAPGTTKIRIISEEGGIYSERTYIGTGVAVTGVSVSPATLSLTKGTSGKLTATVSPENASVKTVNWSSSNESVATVDNSGNVTAVNAGTATITATTTNGNKTATATITVTAPEETNVSVTGVTISPKTLSMVIGSSSDLTATVSPENASNKAVILSSSDTGVATVNNGRVTAVSAGTATITATTVDGAKTDTCAVTVTASAVAVTGVTANPKTMSLKINEYKTLSAVVAPETATNKAVSFVSSDTSVATVNDKGVVTGLKAGNATITITTTDGNFTDTCAVTVVNDVFIRTTGVSFNKKAITLKLNAYDTLSATITPANATNKAVTYTSSDINIAYIDNTGTVTGKGYGVATVTVTTVDGGFSDSCIVTVTDEVVPVSGVSISPKELFVGKGESKQVTATVSPSTATNKGIAFSSSDTSIATVTSDGTVKGLVSGNAIITVTTKDGGFTDTCKVTVSDNKADSETNEPSEEETSENIIPEEKAGFYIVVFYKNETPIYAESVEKGGLVKKVPEVSKENCEFAGWYDKEAKSYWSHVTPVDRNISVYARFKDAEGVIEPIKDVDDNPKESYDDLRTAESKKAYLVPGQKIFIENCSAESSNSDVISVSAKNGGVLIAAKGEGSATLKLEMRLAAEAVATTVEHNIYVNAPKLPAKSLKLTAGQIEDFTVTLGNDTAQYKIVYSSTNPDVAHVYNGQIYAVSKGSATITAHINGKKYNCKVTVKDPVSTIKDATDITMAPLQTLTLKYTDGFNAKKANWSITSISGNNVVTVKKNKVTATGIGMVVVSGMDNKGNTKTISIAVKEATPQVIHMSVGKSKNIKFYKLSNKKAVWTVSDNNAATCPVTVNKGKVKAVKPGTTMVTAAYNGFTFTAYIVVENPQITTDSKLIKSGKKYLLKLSPADSYNLKLTGTNQTVIWTSNKPEIVRVSENGDIIVCGRGRAKLSAKVNGKSFTVNVEIQ
ncbi:MAG: Ig-like domain-containing protein [Lachnospiraceae bacterium]|nr:Ig-like domain-containing protein [Lachnospiraceae bacterium]